MVKKRDDDTRKKPWRTEGVPPASERPRFNWTRFLITLAALYLGFTLVSYLFGGDSAPSVSYTEFSSQVRAGNVATISARGLSIEGTLRNAAPLPGGRPGATYQTFTTDRPLFADDDLYGELTANNVQISATPLLQRPSVWRSLLYSLLPVAVLAGVWIWISRRQVKMLGGLGSKQAKPIRADKVRADFTDVAGIDEVKAELAEVVDFLQRPGKYRRLGAKVPRGVLLTGPPGTGKTLLARAVAGEAGVPFFSASAAEFIEMIVGVGASRVRELFGEARKIAPSIIFIDEIDSIGRARGATAVGGGHDEREQTLNQILTEMDGFSGTEGVVVIAATNRPDVLDPALLRPGRFDRSVTVHPPDTAGREAILRVHVRQVLLASDVDLTAIARSTVGMTGADLANLVNEAALLAAKRDRKAVGNDDFADALEKIQLGAARAVIMPVDERQRTAYHEAGHALLGMLQPGADPVRKISIVPRGRSLGVTLSTPDYDRYSYDEPYLRGKIIGALGGMAAEDVVFGVISTGVESDLRQVTDIARGMVGRWGMSPSVGPLSVLPAEGGERAGAQFGLATLDQVDAEVRRIIGECYDRAKQLLREHRDQLDNIVHALLEHETLDERDAYTAAGVAPALA